jgi:hypothetical protein
VLGSLTLRCGVLFQPVCDPVRAPVVLASAAECRGGEAVPVPHLPELARLDPSTDLVKAEELFHGASQHDSWERINSSRTHPHRKSLGAPFWATERRNGADAKMGRAAHTFRAFSSRVSLRLHARTLWQQGSRASCRSGWMHPTGQASAIGSR